MPIAKEAREAVQRFSTYIEELIALFRRYGVTGPSAVRALWSAVRNPEFKKEWKAIWSKIVEADGSKLTLTTVLAIIGAVLGGVGIAAGGGAIGLPLALLLAPLGYLVGAELDSSGLVKKMKAYFGSSNGASDEPRDSNTELEEITSLVQELLTRTEQADETMRTGSIKASELEQIVSDLRARAERYEEEARKREARIVSLETTASELGKTVAEAKCELAKAGKRLKVVSWTALSLATIALLGMFWALTGR